MESIKPCAAFRGIRVYNGTVVMAGQKPYYLCFLKKVVAYSCRNVNDKTIIKESYGAGLMRALWVGQLVILNFALPTVCVSIITYFILFKV